MLFWNILPFLYTLSLIFWIFHKKTLSIGPSFRTKHSTTEEHLSGLEAAQKFSSFFVAKATTSPWNKASQDWRKRANGSHCCHHLLLGLRNALCEDLAREFQPQAKGWLEWCDVNEFIICCLCVYITEDCLCLLCLDVHAKATIDHILYVSCRRSCIISLGSMKGFLFFWFISSTKNKDYIFLIHEMLFSQLINK